MQTSFEFWLLSNHVKWIWIARLTARRQEVIDDFVLFTITMILLQLNNGITIKAEFYGRINRFSNLQNPFRTHRITIGSCIQYNWVLIIDVKNKKKKIKSIFSFMSQWLTEKFRTFFYRHKINLLLTYLWRLFPAAVDRDWFSRNI